MEWQAIRNFLAAEGGKDAGGDASGEETPFELTEENVPVEVTPENEHLVEAMRQVIDPELGINIIDLGLVYAVEADESAIRVAVTATTPACPMAGVILEDVEDAVRQADPAGRPVEVHLVWEPPWHPERMSERAHEQLGI